MKKRVALLALFKKSKGPPFGTFQKSVKKKKAEIGVKKFILPKIGVL